MASERAFESSQPLEKEKPSFSRVLNEITTLASSGTAVSKRKPRPKRIIENVEYRLRFVGFSFLKETDLKFNLLFSLQVTVINLILA